MTGLIRRSLSRVLRTARRLALGRLAELGDMFDSLSAKLDAFDLGQRAEVGEIRGRLSAVGDMLDTLSAKLDALAAARTASVGSLIDYQIETARYYMKTAMGDIAPGFNALYQQCKNHTIASVEQLYAVNAAVDYLVRSDISGDVVDCGAGRGGTAMMAMLTLVGLQRFDRRVVLLDSFDELPASVGNGKFAEDRVRQLCELLATTAYPAASIEIVSGLIERTVPKYKGAAIAFLRIDTESYTATKAVLETLCPRLAKGGVLLLNDTATLLGPRQAITDFFDKEGKLLLFNRIDYSTRVAVWPS